MSKSSGSAFFPVEVPSLLKKLAISFSISSTPFLISFPAALAFRSMFSANASNLLSTSFSALSKPFFLHQLLLF